MADQTPKSLQRHARPRWASGGWARALRWLGALTLALSGIVLLAVTLQGRSWLARGIAVAPNAGRVFRGDDDLPRSSYTSLGITEQLRIELPLREGSAISLSVWVIEPKRRPLGTVLVLHGIRSDKSWLRGLAARLAERGYRAVLPDLRGHGRSSGDWLTYGVHEARDLKDLIDALEAQGRPSTSLGVVGFSYGAATAIQLAALDARVRAVVAVAPFSSLREVVPGYVEHYLPVVGKLVPGWFVQESIDDAGLLGSFDPNAASSLRAIAATRARVLLIHGSADAHIPPAHSVALHAAAPDRSELVLLEGEDHFTVGFDRTNTVASRGIAWLDRWLDSASMRRSEDEAGRQIPEPRGKEAP